MLYRSFVRAEVSFGLIILVLVQGGGTAASLLWGYYSTYLVLSY